MLWTAGVFVIALGIVCLLCLTEWPSWVGFAGSAIFAASGLIPLIRGPRYVGVLMLLDAVLLAVAAQADRAEAPVVSWSLYGAFIASLFAMGLWPLLEHQCVLSKRDVLFPWGGMLGMYLGCVVGFIWDALSSRVILGATTLIGALLLLQSCQHAWAILRGPRQALLPERGFPAGGRGDPAP